MSYLLKRYSQINQQILQITVRRYLLKEFFQDAESNSPRQAPIKRIQVSRGFWKQSPLPPWMINSKRGFRKSAEIPTGVMTEFERSFQYRRNLLPLFINP